MEGDESIGKKRCSYKLPMDDVNVCTWRWFEKMHHYNLPISGPMIKEQAKVYADSLGFDGFKASNGWLESFKRRHNIGQLKMWQQDILTEYIGADIEDEKDDEDIPQLPLEISSNGDALDCFKHIKRFALEKDMPSLLSICMAGEAELIKL